MGDTGVARACYRCPWFPARPGFALCRLCSREANGYARERRKNRARRGTCIDCPAKATDAAVRCPACLARKRAFYHARKTSGRSAERV